MSGIHAIGSQAAQPSSSQQPQSRALERRIEEASKGALDVSKTFAKRYHAGMRPAVIRATAEFNKEDPQVITLRRVTSKMLSLCDKASLAQVDRSERKQVALQLIVDANSAIREYVSTFIERVEKEHGETLETPEELLEYLLQITSISPFRVPGSREPGTDLGRVKARVLRVVRMVDNALTDEFGAATKRAHISMANDWGKGPTNGNDGAALVWVALQKSIIDTGECAERLDMNDYVMQCINLGLVDLAFTPAITSKPDRCKAGFEKAALMLVSKGRLNLAMQCISQLPVGSRKAVYEKLGSLLVTSEKYTARELMRRSESIDSCLLNPDILKGVLVAKKERGESSSIERLSKHLLFVAGENPGQLVEIGSTFAEVGKEKIALTFFRTCQQLKDRGIAGPQLEATKAEEIGQICAKTENQTLIKAFCYLIENQHIFPNVRMTIYEQLGKQGAFGIINALIPRLHHESMIHMHQGEYLITKYGHKMTPQEIKYIIAFFTPDTNPFNCICQEMYLHLGGYHGVSAMMEAFSEIPLLEVSEGRSAADRLLEIHAQRRTFREKPHFVAVHCALLRQQERDGNASQAIQNFAYELMDDGFVHHAALALPYLDPKVGANLDLARTIYQHLVPKGSAMTEVGEEFSLEEFYEKMCDAVGEHAKIHYETVQSLYEQFFGSEPQEDTYQVVRRLDDSPSKQRYLYSILAGILKGDEIEAFNHGMYPDVPSCSPVMIRAMETAIDEFFASQVREVAPASGAGTG